LRRQATRRRFHAGNRKRGEPDHDQRWPPPCRRQDQRGEQTRQKILDAAEREIGMKGFAEASISTITAEAAVAQGTFYVYFRSKDDVARELVLRTGRQLRHYLTLATTGIDDRLEVERRGIHAFLKFVRDHPNLYRIVTEMQFVDPRRTVATHDDFAAGYRVALEAAAARGRISRRARGRARLGADGRERMVGRKFALWDASAPLERVAEARHMR